jgi:hypothetical protein
MAGRDDIGLGLADLSRLVADLHDDPAVEYLERHAASRWSALANIASE